MNVIAHVQLINDTDYAIHIVVQTNKLLAVFRNEFTQTAKDIIMF